MTTKSELDEIQQRGFLIVREAIPSAELEPLREMGELFLNRAREHSAGDHNVGWERHRVPHPDLYAFSDCDTAALFDPLVSDRVLDTNRRLMRADSAGLNSAALFTEPKRQLEKTFQWHRDSVLRPTAPLPLLGLQADHQANAPGVLTWNIPLHDDASLWVVPGSNRRGNTQIEQEVLERPKMLSDEPVPGAVRCELGAGDAAVFDATMMHSGSNDAKSYRRTFNASYRGFGGPVFAHSRSTSWRPDLGDRLSPPARQAFSRFQQLFEEELGVMEVTFRAIIEADSAAFREQLARLHPGTEGRIACVVLLHKVAHSLYAMSLQNPPVLDHEAHHWRTGQLCERFSTADLRTLWRRFETLDERLLDQTPGVDADPEVPAYEQVAMPEGFDVEEFIASWEAD